MKTEAQKRAKKKFEATNCKQISLQLNYNTDAEVIAWLDKQTEITGSRQGYIKALIKADIERNNSK